MEVNQFTRVAVLVLACAFLFAGVPPAAGREQAAASEGRGIHADREDMEHPKAVSGQDPDAASQEPSAGQDAQKEPAKAATGHGHETEPAKR